MSRFHGPHTIALGSAVAELETPSLVVDLDAMERNIARMASFAAQAGLRWRPHAKLHKCGALALQLIDAGASGCCVQKLAEAEAMQAAGVNDIYISNEVLDARKLQRVAQLAQSAHLAIATDSAVGVRRLAQAMAKTSPGSHIDVFIEINVGQSRAGLHSDDDLVMLAREIASHPPLRFVGLHAYHGGAQHIEDATTRAQTMQQAYERVRSAQAKLAAAGFTDLEVTGAGTGTFALEAASGIYTELQPGSFLFMDAHYARVSPVPHQPVFEHALFIKTQVISCAPTHVVVDAGHKSHAIDSGLPVVWNDGRTPVYQFANGGDEHGIIRPCETAASAQLPAWGDNLWLVPGHCDPTVNLHDVLIGVRAGLHEGHVERLLPVDARGALW